MLLEVNKFTWNYIELCYILIMEIDKVYNESNIDTCKKLPDDSIDLVVTSPPYDNLRDYKGYTFDFEELTRELYRIIKPGGVVVWVVNDATIDGSESCSSFRQAIYFTECGFKLHDTMIYEKASSSFPASVTDKRYTQIFEYMFVFCKGKIRDDVNLICDKKNKYGGAHSWGKLAYFKKDGTKGIRDRSDIPIKEYSPRTNIWTYNVGLNDVTGHPAVFPEQLAEDHILTWSQEGDIVYDPFMGSGTTAKMAMLNNRHYIGSEISKEYCDLIIKRLNYTEKYEGKTKFNVNKEKENKIQEDDGGESLF